VSGWPDDVEKEMEEAGISGPSYRRARLKLGVQRKQRNRRWWIGLSEGPESSGDQALSYLPVDHVECVDHPKGNSGDPDDQGDRDDRNTQREEVDHLTKDRAKTADPARLPESESDEKLPFQ
jgi:hypothetical protein